MTAQVLTNRCTITPDDFWAKFAEKMRSELKLREPVWRNWYSATSGNEWTRFVVDDYDSFLVRLAMDLGYARSTIFQRKQFIDVSCYGEDGRELLIEHENAHQYSILEGQREKGWKQEFTHHMKAPEPLRVLIRYYSHRARHGHSIEQEMSNALSDFYASEPEQEVRGRILHIVGPYYLDSGLDYSAFTLDGDRFRQLPVRDRILPLGRDPLFGV